MPKLPLLKRRNGNARERTAQNNYIGGIVAAVMAKISVLIIRTDLLTGTETVKTKRELEDDLLFNCKFFFSKIHRFAPYTGEFELIWRELEKGATFHTKTCAYNVEIFNKCSKTAS